jgi:hypothetical protein
MKIKKILTILAFLPTFIIGQNKELNLDSIFDLNSIDMSNRIVYRHAEEMPRLLNGESIIKYLSQYSDMYTYTYNRIFVSKVYISFVVEKDSTISNKKVLIESLFDKYNGLIFEEEKITQIQKYINIHLEDLEKMIPGKINNQNVAIQLVLPINFDINFYNENTLKPLRKYRNYDFDVSLNVQDLQFAPDFNFKYLINLKSERDANNNLFFYKKNMLQKVNFIYKYNKNILPYNRERVPKDTLQYILDNKQLDSIYTLTAKIFQPEFENLSKDSINYTQHYDGYWAEIEFNNISQVLYKVSISGISDEKTLFNYYNLLSYLKSLEKDRVYFPKVYAEN